MLEKAFHGIYFCLYSYATKMFVFLENYHVHIEYWDVHAKFCLIFLHFKIFKKWDKILRLHLDILSAYKFILRRIDIFCIVCKKDKIQYLKKMLFTRYIFVLCRYAIKKIRVSQNFSCIPRLSRCARQFYFIVDISKYIRRIWTLVPKWILN